MSIIGYISAIVIGITLGLIGGGGSILTVPALVYGMGIGATDATAYSLFIVGITALAGAVDYIRKGLVSFRAAAVFALPSLLAVYLTRRFVVPAIPEQIISLGDFAITRDIALMLLFAVLMVASSISMIRSGGSGSDETGEPNFNYPIIVAEGLVVGMLTGLVGAGGGFLIIPALVLLAKLPMRMAVGTSLLVIAAKSLIGFLGDLSTRAVDWPLLVLFSVFAIGGTFIGSQLSKVVSGAQLKKGFGWFVLAMGIMILARETGLVSF